MAIKSKKWTEMSIEKLVTAAWNYKKDDPAKAEKLKANIKRNGQVENILVRLLPTGFYEVVNGNHRLMVFQELGLKNIVVFNLGKISDAQARRVAVETNETKFETDNVRLAEVFKEMIDEEFTIEDLTESMPFELDEIQDMQKLLDFDWDAYEKEKGGNEEEEEEGEGEPDSVVCPNCKHVFEV